MEIQQNTSLKTYNTFGIEAKAKYFCEINSVLELSQALQLTDYPKKFFISGGSNMLITQDIDALVLHINIKGIEIIYEDEDQVHLKVSAGENWHQLILWTLEQNYGGLENMSLIPGNTGTAPIQNIGAYGVELKDSFESCEAMHITTQKPRTFSNEECQFGYRDSYFKNKGKGQYVITSVNFRLTKKNHVLNTSYGAIETELEKQKIKQPKIKDISNAVIAIRQSKLPDPAEIGNSGSFFKNPVILKTKYATLKANFPDMPSYEISETLVKIPAGWLIEHAGFKGKTLGNYGIHKNQALVLVNYGSAKGEDIRDLAFLIQKTILQIFDIQLEAEVNII